MLAIQKVRQLQRAMTQFSVVLAVSAPLPLLTVDKRTSKAAAIRPPVGLGAARQLAV
jgi:hypothetical protein